MKIPLRNRKGLIVCYTEVGPEDYEFLSSKKWTLSNKGYAVRGIKRDNKKAKESIHRLVLERVFGSIPKDLVSDHIDRNRLNNTRNNLRLATRSQNQANCLSKNKSGYRGVQKNQNRKKWRCVIKLNQHSFHLGYFLTKQEASKAYNEKAKELFGEFATLNPIKW